MFLSDFSIALPTYNQCMFGTTSIAEIDSDIDEGQNHNEVGFAPHYVSYNLINSKRLLSGMVLLINSIYCY